MKRLLLASGLALLLAAIVTFSSGIAAAQDAGTPGPPATPRIVDGGGVEGPSAVEEALESRFWGWLGWPAMVGSAALGSFWAYRRVRSRPLKALLSRFASGEGERPQDASPIVESPSGWRGLQSGGLLLALTTSMSFGISALYDYPSHVSGFQPWIDAVPWVWYLGGTLLVGLLSESRGVGAIPITGLLLGLLLWHSTPGESVDGLFYDVGWLGFLIGPVALWSVVLYLLFRIGRALR